MTALAGMALQLRRRRWQKLSVPLLHITRVRQLEPQVPLRNIVPPRVRDIKPRLRQQITVLGQHHLKRRCPCAVRTQMHIKWFALLHAFTLTQSAAPCASIGERWTSTAQLASVRKSTLTGSPHAPTQDYH